MPYKFKLHQQVRMVRSGMSDALASDIDVFEVVRLMPEDRSGEAAYRIRSMKGERAVRESEIVALH
ncbi:hypothetical protein NS228_19980 [Methylobacterium indicum]|uniref:hypothetical protein n=1 Tax=Methylobacterium indicum TaxID=1775910 RepID=UPI000733E9C2|nr:hypothetical protein [Methylobacterium indicum]KTS36836.1 hypothetical protein NS228_19980 [Methylobacterium indicum]KTS37015.1 hypothetical protein NS229_08505 [Methylobacterium indicum]KTS48041.1 hypothetical protein NS230_19870 [Methylobacterium indicum]